MNLIRNSNGSKDLQVTPYAMAVAELNANYSAYVQGHSGQNLSENLAWGEFSTEDNSNGAYGGWYDDEKALYESGTTAFSRVGHYLNLIETSYTTTGFALVDDDYTSKTWSQVFGNKYTDGTQSFEVGEYIDLLKEYYQEVMPEHYQAYLYNTDLTQYATYTDKQYSYQIIGSDKDSFYELGKYSAMTEAAGVNTLADQRRTALNIVDVDTSSLEEVQESLSSNNASLLRDYLEEQQDVIEKEKSILETKYNELEDAKEALEAN